MVVIGQKCRKWDKVVVFGQSGCYSGKSSCNRAKLLYSGETGCFRAMSLFPGKVVLFGQNGCSRDKWW